MGLKKGQTNNLKGRPKGTLNKTTLPMREFLNTFLDQNRGTLQRDWNTLDPVQRITLFEKLLRFVLPPIQSVSVEGKIDFNSLSENDLDIIIEKILGNVAYDSGKKGSLTSPI